jgi:hypothetical protein
MRLKVRYMKVSGWSEWIECLNVDVRDSWLIITLPGEKAGAICGWIAVPDHVVRGRVEVLPA